MELYLTGAPLSTKRNRWSPIALDLKAESERLALVSRAEQLHRLSPTGLSFKAAGLKVRGTISHLRRAQSEHYLLLYWITLSDGSKHRAAWVRKTAEGSLCERWDRVAWSSIVFSLNRLRKRPRRAG
jgi:hypothetical protein